MIDLSAQILNSLSFTLRHSFFIPAFDTSLQTYLFQTSIDAFISFDVLGLVCVVVCVCVAGGVWVGRRGGLGHWHEGTQCISWSCIPVSTLCVWMCSCVTVFVWCLCLWVMTVCVCLYHGLCKGLWLCLCSLYTWSFYFFIFLLFIF